MKHNHKLVYGGVIASMALVFMAATTPVDAARIVTSVRGYAQARFHPGATMRVTSVGLPVHQDALCVGLASRLDPSGLPLNMGRVTRRVVGAGPIYGTATITLPSDLLTYEPSGAWMVFIGSCAGSTVDGPALAVTTISIEKAPTGV